MPAGHPEETHSPAVALMTTVPAEFNNSRSCEPACTPVGDPKFRPGFTLTVEMTAPLLVARTFIPDDPDGSTMAQFSASVPVLQPSGCAAPLQEALCSIVLYHIDPTALASDGGAMLPPALYALMKDVTSGCQAVCGKLACGSQYITDGSDDSDHTLPM